MNRQYRISDRTVDRLQQYARARRGPGKNVLGITVDELITDVLREVGF